MNLLHKLSIILSENNNQNIVLNSRNIDKVMYQKFSPSSLHSFILCILIVFIHGVERMMI
jgi:hypothetical protein